MDAAPPARRDLLESYLTLCRQARALGRRAELEFLLVNASRELAPMAQAVLVIDARVQRLSGVSQVDAQAPFVKAVKKLVAAELRQAGEPRVFDLSAADGCSELPPHALWLPFAGMTGSGALFLRTQDWPPADRQWLAEWASVWLHAWKAAGRAGGGGTPLRRWMLRLLTPAAVAALAAAGWFVKVPLTVLAQAELVSRNPVVVRAPFDGVVGEMRVLPNQRVAAGAPLFDYDRSLLRARLDVARQAADTAQAELRQAQQQALSDPAWLAQLAPLAGKLEERRTEHRHLSGQFARTQVAAPEAGIVQLDDAAEWAGRPVAAGERVLRIARNDDVELELWIGIDDLVPLAQDAALTMHPNPDPLRAIPARLRSLSWEATSRPDGSLAYRARATIDAPPAAGSTGSIGSIGVKGVARIAGEPVRLGYWVLRRPLAALRQFFGA
jgi:multidrug efflux pump subunit AcrA (membrane-fusion protein)